MFSFQNDTKTDIETEIRIKRKPRANQYTQAKADLPETAVGFCANHYCGMVLFEDPADVPPGWILIWHVNCGGYCPECALELSAETLLILGIDPAAKTKARLILDTIPANASNPKEEEDDDKDNDPDEWDDF